jgi:hypothetical protein
MAPASDAAPSPPLTRSAGRTLCTATVSGVAARRQWSTRSSNSESHRAICTPPSTSRIFVVVPEAALELLQRSGEIRPAHPRHTIGGGVRSQPDRQKRPLGDKHPKSLWFLGFLCRPNSCRPNLSFVERVPSKYVCLRDAWRPAGTPRNFLSKQEIRSGCRRLGRARPNPRSRAGRTQSVLEGELRRRGLDLPC